MIEVADLMHLHLATKQKTCLKRIFASLATCLLVFNCPAAQAFSFSLPIPIPLPSTQGQQDPNVVAFYKFCHEGYEATMNKNYQSAATSYRQALSIRPDDSNAHLGYGHALLYLKHPQEAIIEFKKALGCDHNNANAWMNLVAAFIDSNRLQEAVACGEEYLRRFPHSKESANVQSQVNSAQEQLNRQNLAQRSMFGPPSATDYLALSCERGAHRWSLTRMPLKVFIADGKGVPKYQPEFADAMMNAFRQWSIASGGNIRFERIEDPAAADINVEWTGDVSNLLKRIELGQATGDRMDGDCIGHATIIMVTRNRNLHLEMTPRIIGITALHEIGHALGLEGHSDNPNDIMYYSETRATQNISMRDVMTLQRLYMLPEDAVVASFNGPSSNAMLAGQQQQVEQPAGFNQQQPNMQYQQPGNVQMAPPEFSVNYNQQNDLSMQWSPGNQQAGNGGAQLPQEQQSGFNPAQLLNQLQQAFQPQSAQNQPKAPNMVPYPQQPLVPPGSSAFNQYQPQGMMAAPSSYPAAPVGYYGQNGQQ